MSAIPRDFMPPQREADMAFARNLNNNHQPLPASSSVPPDVQTIMYYPLRFPVLPSSGGVYQNAPPPGAGTLERDEAMRVLGLNEGELRYIREGKYVPFPDPSTPFMNAYPNNYPLSMPPGNFPTYPASGMPEVDQRNGPDPLMMVMPNGMHAPFRGFQDPRLPDNAPVGNVSQLMAAQDYSRAQPSKRRAPGAAEDRHVKKRSQGKDQMNNIMGEILGDSRGIKEAGRPGPNAEIILQPPRPFPSGGRYCRFPECTRKAQGRTDFCISHGGGRRCATEGCERGAAGASSFCKKHGGGHRCLFPGCDHSSQGPSSFCIRHGGGYRCRYPDCDKSARSAQSFCYRHGGGRKGCEAPGCSEIAVGTTTLCKKHTRAGVDLQQRTAVPTERAAACLLPHSTEAQAQMGRPPYMAGYVAGHEAGGPYVPSGVHPGAVASSLNGSLSDDPSTKTTDMTEGDSSYLSF